MKCENHSDVQAIGRCADCMGAFCADCLVAALGERYCTSCRPTAIREKTAAPCKEATDALKMAVIGLIIIGIVLEPIAISKALKARKIINSNPHLTGLGKANAALVISVIYLLLLTLFIVALNLRSY